jgi:exopolyphosphatase/guanosine-5'-triphosphate,3'-diphosphate pyrophosphatase
MKIEKYGGIDIGSNGVRLLIMNVFEVDKKAECVKAILVRAPVRLGSDSFVRNEIEDDTKEMLCEAMKSFLSLMKCYKVKHYRACATSALREADNQKEVINYVLNHSGVKIEIIDGAEEAEIIYRTQIKEIIDDNNGYLFIDVGGGSTEVTYYSKKKVVASRSFKIGAVRSLKNLVEHSQWVELESFISSIKIYENSVAIGTGGNINTLFKKSEKPFGKPLTLKYLKETYRDLNLLTVDERIIQYKFNPDRADVIVPAINIYCQIMKFANIKEIYVPKIGLADGLIRDLYAKKTKLN